MKEAIPSELLIAHIADRTGWTYQQIISQPQWLIDVLLLKWRIDGEKKSS